MISKIMLVCLVCLPFSSCAHAGNYSKNPLAIDKSVRVGHLPNGFTYYLKPTYHTDKISLRFYVKVSGYNERLEETQFAHLAEHLGYHVGFLKAYHENGYGFNTSGGILSSSANTASAYTVYYSTQSSNDPTTLQNTLNWFKDICDLNLEDEIIIRESRCLRQEFFNRAQGLALNRTFNEFVYNTALFFDKNGESPYSCWFSNYDMGGISISSIRNFYQHWYRPDRMGLVVTGNIKNLEKFEKNLINLYSKIPKSTVMNEDLDVRQLYLSAPKRFKTVERKVLNRFSSWNNENSEVFLFFRVKNFHFKLDTKDKWLNEKLYKTMYALILQQLIKKGAPSLSVKKGGTVDVDLPDRDYSYFRVPGIINSPGTEKENIQRVISVLQLLRKNGFTQLEWDIQKQLMLNQIMSKDTSSTKYWDEQLKNHFVYGEILPLRKKEITKRWIENLCLKDINSYLKDNFSVMPDDIIITASKGHPSLLYTENQVRRWIKEAIKDPVVLKEIVDTPSLTPIHNKNSSLMCTKKIEELQKRGYHKAGKDLNTGLDILELNNGVKIILDQKEPYLSKSKNISIKGISPRGASYLPADKYYAAISSTEIVKQSGAGKFSRKTIRDKLGGNFPVNTEPVQINIKANKSTISARTKQNDLDKYLQLIYLYFTSPRNDSLAFTNWQKKISQRYLDNISNVVNPMGTDFKNAIADYLGLSFFKAPTFLMSTEQFYQKQNVELEKAMQCYQTIFGDASDFTFIIKGSYIKDEVLPLLQKYLGNLPTNDHLLYTADSTVKADTNLPKGPIYHTFYASKIKTAYKLYTTPYAITYVFKIQEDNWKDRVVLNLIKTYLRPKIDIELRYIKGGSFYNTYTEAKYSEKGNLFRLSVFIEALDDELDWIRSEVKTMITDLKRYGMEIEDKDRLLEDPIFFGEYSSTPKIKSKVLQYARSLTSEDIKKVASKYLRKKNQYEFVFRESKEILELP